MGEEYMYGRYVARVRQSSDPSLPPMKDYGYRMKMSQCPLSRATPMDWRIIKMGRLHSQDPRALDLTRESANIAQLVLVASEWHRGMAIKNAMVAAHMAVGG
jgi:hypothetical protein